MASWLAALAGLGKGSGGLPEGLIQREKFDLEGERIGQADRRAAEQSRQFTESQARQASQFQQQEDRLTRAETTDLTPLMKMGVLPTGSPTSTPTTLAGPLMAMLGKKQEQSQDRDRLGQLAGVMESQAVEMPPAGPRAEHELPTTTDPNMLALSKVIPMLSRSGAEGIVADRFKKEVPKTPEPFTLGEGQTRYGPTGEPIAAGPAKAEKPDKPTQSGEVARIAAAIAEATQRGDAREVARLRAHLDDVKSYILPEAGTLVGGGTRTPLAAGSGPPPAPGERERLSDFKSAIELGQSALARWDTDWPSWRQRLGNRELPLVGGRVSDVAGGKMTPQQESLYADASHVVGEIRRALSGLAVTDPEARRMLPALPNDPSNLTREQLASAVSLLERKRGNINQTLESVGRRQGPSMGQSPVAPRGTQAPQDAGTWRLRETATGRVRPYRPAPGETQPPAGYERVQ